MATLTETMHEGEFIGELAMGIGFHVDPITLKLGQNKVAGAVLGANVAGTSASAAKAGGNTGNGTFTLDATAPIQPGAKEGVYVVTCIAAAVNGGTFRVEDPDGTVLGDVAVGATFSDDIKFVIADGATDFIVGDAFNVTISALTYKHLEYDPAGTDGSQIVSGILMKNTNATAADVVTTALKRGPAVVNANDLTWKTGMTAAQKTTARNALQALGIKAA